MLKKFRPLETDDARKDIVIQAPASSGIMMERYGKIDRHHLYIAGEPSEVKDINFIDYKWLEANSAHGRIGYGSTAGLIYVDGVFKTHYIQTGHSGTGGGGPTDHIMVNRTWNPVTDVMTESKKVLPIGDWNSGNRTWISRGGHLRDQRYKSYISNGDYTKVLLFDFVDETSHIIELGFESKIYARNTQVFYTDAGFIIYAATLGIRKIIDYATKTVRDLPEIKYPTNGSVVNPSYLRCSTTISGDLRILDNGGTWYDLDGVHDPVATEYEFYLGPIDENNAPVDEYGPDDFLDTPSKKNIKISKFALGYVGKLQGKLFHYSDKKMILSTDDAFYIDVVDNEKFIIPPGKMLYYVPGSASVKSVRFPSFIATMEI